MLNFNFLEKCLGIVSPPHFEYDFSRKMFLIVHLLTVQFSVSGCLYILRYWTIYELQLLVNQVVTS